MKQPVIFQPERRLATMLRAQGGIEVRDAVGKASAGLEGMRENMLGAIDGKIARLGAAMEAGCGLQEVHVLATEIFSLAGTFELSELANAAASLAGILEPIVRDSDRSDDARNSPKLGEALRVHVAALSLLRRLNADGDAASRQAVVSGLRDVALRIATPPDARSGKV